MTFVVDTSVSLARCFEDERTDTTDALLWQVATYGAIAPGLWPLEVLNGLATGERRGRLKAVQRQSEPPRVWRRLHFLRRWSHEQVEEVLARST